MNYGELKQALANEAHRTDLTDRITLAITQAENRIYEDIKASENEYWKQVSITESPFALPYEWVSAREVTVGGDNGTRYALEYLPPREFYRASKITIPTVYTINQRAMSILSAPSVDAPLALQLGYWGRLNPLTNDSDENPMLTSYPSLFIYAAMYELAGFTQDLESEGAWEKRYMQAVERINGANQEGRQGLMAMRAS